MDGTYVSERRKLQGLLARYEDLVNRANHGELNWPKEKIKELEKEYYELRQEYARS